MNGVANTNQVKTNYHAIDLARFVAACLIVALHASPLTSVSENFNFYIKNGLSRLAVPFFFMASGFFLATKMTDYQKVKQYITNILRMYIIWSAVYLPIIVIDWHGTNRSMIYQLVSLARNVF